MAKIEQGEYIIPHSRHTIRDPEATTRQTNTRHSKRDKSSPWEPEACPTHP